MKRAGRNCEEPQAIYTRAQIAHTEQILDQPKIKERWAVRESRVQLLRQGSSPHYHGSLPNGVVYVFVANCAVGRQHHAFDFESL